MQGDAAVTDRKTEADADDTPAAKPADERKPTAPPAPPPSKSRSGRGVAWLALLLAMAALLVAGWDQLAARGWVPPMPGTEAEERAPEPAEPALEVADVEALVEDRLEGLEASLTRRLRSGLEASASEQSEELAALRDQLRRELRTELRREGGRREERLAEATAELAELRRALAGLAEEVAAASPPDSREWRVAEAGYLLRIANQRARLERDVRGALELVRAAQNILAEIDDFRLVPVRETLLESEAALAAQPQVDRVGLYLQLERHVQAVNQWQVSGPQAFQAESEGEPDPAADWWQALQRRLSGLVEIRRDGADRTVPLTPDDRALLQHNIHLKLLHAQLALLRGEQEIWRTSLETAAGWADAADVDQELSAGLRTLAETPIRPRVPDISAPLRLLDRLHLRDEENDQ